MDEPTDEPSDEPTDDPTNEELDRLADDIRGFCDPLSPPVVYPARQKHNLFSQATKAHERCHALLLNSSTYARLQQILCFLLREECPHFPRSQLVAIYNATIKNSITCHEGCATLSAKTCVSQQFPDRVIEYESNYVSPYYAKCCHIYEQILDQFDLHPAVGSWLALEFTAFCLSTPLFGPFTNVASWTNSQIAKILENDKYSANSRLQLLRDRITSKNDKTIREPIRRMINAHLKLAFGSLAEVDFFNRQLRISFITTFEPVLEQFLENRFPGYYQTSTSESRMWARIYPTLQQEFSKIAKCDCLLRFPFGHLRLTKCSWRTTPVLRPDRRPHATAKMLHRPEYIASVTRKDGMYYFQISIGSTDEPFVISENPSRALHRNELYVRFQELHFDQRRQHFIWERDYFALLASPGFSGYILSVIKGLNAIVSFTTPGEISDVMNRANMLMAELEKPICVQIDGLMIDMFPEIFEAMPRRIYNASIWKDELDDLVLILMSRQLPRFRVAFPLTEEVLAGVAPYLNRHPHINFIRGSKIDNTDKFHCYHLISEGW